MAFYTHAELRNAFRDRGSVGRSAEAVLSESVRKARMTVDGYDVFLSHSLLDATEIAGLKGVLEGHGFSVYVDWVEDPQLDRTKVTPASANVLRERMKRCSSLLYASSESAGASRWMPWELGYFDGRLGKAAIFPVVDRDPGTDDFKGQEYLGIYPYVVRTGNTLWVHRDKSTFKTLRDWIKANDRSFLEQMLVK